MITLKDIITDLNTFADDHKQINDFGFGNISNITTKDHTFPMLWVMPVNTNYESYTTKLNFEVYVLDLLTPDNVLDVINDTMLILNDVISEFFEDNDERKFELDDENVSIDLFEGKFDDLTGGVIGNITIDIINRKNCNYPK